MRRSITLVARLALFANSARASRSTCRPTRYQASNVAATPKASAVQANGSGRRTFFMLSGVSRRDRIAAFPALPVALIVQKYGGTSMGSVERIREVARRVARFAAEGHQLVVVPSAMAGETNRLLGLARELNPDPSPRELDVVAYTGEQVSIGLLAIALQKLGLKARSYTGFQVRILTDDAQTKARILSIDDGNIRKDI